jgi:hypothetical protein
VIQAGGAILCSEIRKLIYSIWNGEELADQGRRLLSFQFRRRVIKLTVVSWDITVINFIQNCIQYSSLKVKSIYR